MHIERYRHPVLFYALATALPWTFWIAAAYLSHRPAQSGLLAAAVGVLGVVGLASPTVLAATLVFRDPAVRKEVLHRCVNFREVAPVYLFLAAFLMPGSILLAQAISLLFGHSADQFRLAGHASFSAGIFPGWFLLFLAPLLEELAWHSYGTDCLRQRFTLLATSLMFGVYWVVWHVPLSFIAGYYHSNLVQSGWIHSLNFALSLIPFVVLMNWLYYKAKRNIAVAIVFHVTAGEFNEAFRTHPDSKVIQTALLLALSAWLVLREKAFFLKRAYAE